MKTRKVEHDHKGICNSTCADEFAPKPPHTPTPWHHKPLSWTHEAGHAIFSTEEKQNGIRTHRLDDKGVFSEPDAAFIVRAVNSHQEMLSALKNLLALVDRELIGNYSAVGMARRAIEKAEGKGA